MMQIICPNCQTSYDVDASAFGARGRNVRCVRCRETWLVQAQEPAASLAADDSGTMALQPEKEEAFAGPAGNNASPPHADTAENLIEIESPPLAHDPMDDPDRPEKIIDETPISTFGRKASAGRISIPRLGIPKIKPPRVSLRVAVAAMAGLCIALVIWRQDVVRTLPQSAGFFEAIRLPVNLRQMALRDVSITTETVNGAKVYLIEGIIFGTGKTPADIPRLRFVVSDERGKEIYAWNALPEQGIVQPGAKVTFRSRLASPPDDARTVTVRFFNRRDLTAGRA